jgi:hypothetical protein
MVSLLEQQPCFPSSTYAATIVQSPWGLVAGGGGGEGMCWGAVELVVLLFLLILHLLEGCIVLSGPEPHRQLQ